LDGHVVCHITLSEAFELHVMAQVMQLQIMFECLERTLRQDQIRRTKRSNQEQFGRFPAPRDRRDDVYRGTIHPVEIFEDEYERHRLADLLERLAEFTHHTLAGRALNLSLESRLLVCTDEGWKLNEPRWCICRQRVDDKGFERTPCDDAKRFEQGIVRLLASE